jgi:hypothetical protein
MFRHMLGVFAGFDTACVGAGIGLRASEKGAPLEYAG